jgi:hypothetical protein
MPDLHHVVDALRTAYDTWSYPIILIGALLENTALLGLVLPGGSLVLLGAGAGRQIPRRPSRWKVAGPMATTRAAGTQGVAVPVTGAHLKVGDGVTPAATATDGRNHAVQGVPWRWSPLLYAPWRHAMDKCAER